MIVKTKSKNIIKLTIPYPTVVKKNSKSFNRKTGIPYKSQRLREYEILAIDKIKKQSLYFGFHYDYELPITKPIIITYRFYQQRYSHKYNVPMGDISNLIEAPQDCLERAGIIEDDTLIKKIKAYKYYDKDYPRCEIEISLYEEDSNDD